MSSKELKLDFGSLGSEEVGRMRDAGRIVLDSMDIVERSGSNLVAEVMRGEDGFYEWRHYPGGDVCDFTTGAQYYYHAHPRDERPDEHGHFHCFIRHEDGTMTHIVAISIDLQGNPFRLFTTNRWVTGESWRSAGEILGLIDRFDIMVEQPSLALNRWVSNMLKLFRPQIATLLHDRDSMIRNFGCGRELSEVLDDRECEVASEAAIDIRHQCALLKVSEAA